MFFGLPRGRPRPRKGMVGPTVSARSFGMAFLRCCYHQILGPRRHLPKFANGLCRYSDVWVHFDPHLIWQATKSYVERGNAFGLISHIRYLSKFALSKG